MDNNWKRVRIAMLAALAIVSCTLNVGQESVAANKSVLATTKRVAPAKTSVLIVYTDYQCSACRKFQPILRAAKSKYGSRLQVVLRNFPIPSHKNAKVAAYAAEAAGMQGKFWPMYEKLYGEQASWIYSGDPIPTFGRLAQGLSLNVPKFMADIRSATVKSKVAADMRLAMATGVHETPTVLLNGKAIAATNLSRLDEQIHATLR